MYRNIYIDRSKYTCIMEIKNISTPICNTRIRFEEANTKVIFENNKILIEEIK